ncbi:MAG: hypothetical protein ACKV2T_10015 [Kofleriaceae bacterium]
MSRIAVSVSLLLIACSSGTTSSSGPTGPSTPNGSAAPDAAPAPIVLTREECEAMVKHVVELTVAEQGSAATTSDREKVRAGLEPFVAECPTLRPEIHRCALAATTLTEVEACQRPAADSAGDTK